MNSQRFCQYGYNYHRPTIESDTEQCRNCRDCEATSHGHRHSDKTVGSGIVFLPRKYRRRKIDWMLLQFLFSFYLLLLCDAKRQPTSGPPRLERARVKVTATVGQPRLLLKCGVKSDIRPLIKWKFNGVPISVGHTRLRVTNNNLRIKNVQADDSGQYTCIASNLYGKVKQQINLVVNDARGSTASSKPRFTMPSRMRRKRLTKPSNSMLKLRCAASGHPTPDIQWFKDGNLTHPPGGSRRRAWTFKIKKLQQNDTGTYTCRVWNSQGEISYTYDVRVVEQLRKKPVLLAPHPMNTTVQVGGMTAIQCRVQSLVRPTVKWIKKIEKKYITGTDDSLRSGNLITIDGSHFLILPTQEMLDLPENTYLNKLVIRGATETHAGMYICLAANTMGYNFRYAYLTVVPGPLNSSASTNSPRTRLLPPSNNQSGRSSFSLPVMIGVPAGIGLVVVILLACICQKTKAWRLQNTTAKNAIQRTARLSAFDSAEAKSSTRSTPIPQDCDYGAADEQWDKEQKINIDSEFFHQGRNSTNYYTYNHRVPPTVGTPLLTVEEPDGSESKSYVTDDDAYCNVPVAPPCSEVTSPCPTERMAGFHPPPPSQKSASSISSYHMRAPHLHYHYMHPPGNSRRHNHHPKRGHHHYGH